MRVCLLRAESYPRSAVQQQPQYSRPDSAFPPHKLFRLRTRWDKEMTVLSILMSYFCRYYFVVEEDNTPLSVTVTPCDAPLEWKLTLQELPEEASGEGSGIIPISPPVEEV